MLSSAVASGAVGALVIALAQFIGKVIPDSAGGVAGVIRKLAKLISLYVPNKV